MNAIVGYTGFVGSNIFAQGSFGHAFHSKNIQEAYGLNPGLLVYAGLRAEKYLANHAPEKDKELVEQAKENIRRIQPKKLVLISTIDVFANPAGVNEYSAVGQGKNHAYGWNRYQLECWAREHYPDGCIIRLPGLFGKNLKKNFIYDYMNIIPAMLKKEKLDELEALGTGLKDYYELREDGFYQCRKLTWEETETLKRLFCKAGFTALNFTDSRSMYQFYPLERLWADIQIVLDHGIRVWHPAVEPVSAAELYTYLSDKPFCNELAGTPVNYDSRTVYAGLFGGEGGYICKKQEIMNKIKMFVMDAQNQKKGELK